jgi:hypothetical protein
MIQNICLSIIDLIAPYRLKTINMKRILLILFLLATLDNLSAQNTDPLSYHNSRQLSNTSFSIKKPSGDSTIFLFEGGNISDLRTMSLNADSTQLIWKGADQPSDTLEIWGITGGPGNEIQVQSDYGQTDSTKINFIKNKPATPTQFNPIAGTGIILSGAYPNITFNSSGGAATTDKWDLSGNSGTVLSNFIGTTDNNPLRFKVNNIESGIIGIAPNYSVSFGINSLPYSSTGVKNTALGSATLNKNTVGINNTAVGYSSLYNNISGSYNTALGWSTLGYDSSGIGNTAIGWGAMNQSTASLHIGGRYNTAIGYGSLGDNYNNQFNIGLGRNAGYKTFDSNTLFISDSTNHIYFNLDSAVGTPPSVIGKDENGYWHVYQAGSTPSLDAVSAIGSVVNRNITVNGHMIGNAGSGAYNTYGLVVGKSSLSAITGTNSNLALGGSIMNLLTSGTYNVGIGGNTLHDATSGTGNIAVGPATLGKLIDGSYNTAMGYGTGKLLHGDYNTLIGNDVMGNSFATTTDTTSLNVLIGYQSGRGKRNGNRNTYIGTITGYNSQSHRGVFIGYGAGYNETQDDKLHIANRTDTSLIDGDFAARTVDINGSFAVKVMGTSDQASTKPVGIAPDGKLYQIPDWPSGGGNVLSKVAVLPTDPTTTDIPAGFTAVYTNSTSGTTSLWANIGGTLLKTQLN